MQASLVGIILGLAATATGGDLADGAFEQVQDCAFAHWQVQARDATVSPDRVRGKWYHFICDVKTGRFDKIDLYIAMSDGVGSTWWDNFTSEKLNIINPSFEQVDRSGRPLGWRLDNHVTISSDVNRTTHGKRSLRLTHAKPRPISRVRQIIAVKKNTDYRFEFDMFFSDNCTARPNIATMTFESDGKYAGSPIYLRTPSWSDIRTERAGHGEYVAQIKLAGGEGELQQTVALARDRNVLASVDVKTQALDGEVRLIVEDAGEGVVLGTASLTAANANWQPLQARFQTRGSTGVKLRLVGRGTGEVRLDHADLLEGIDLVPPAQQANWLPASENFRLHKSLRVYVEGETGQVFEQGAMSILRKDLAKLFVELEPARSPGAAHLQIKIGPSMGIEDRGPESYSLVVNPLKMRITAQTDTGALYAIATLVQLMHQFGKAPPVVLACEIHDWPDMPVRGAFWSRDFHSERFARHKLNAIYYSTSWWLDWIHEPQYAEKCLQPLDEADKFGLDLYASTAVFQGHWVYKYHNPHLTEGKYVEAENHTLKGVTPSPLGHALVIHTPRRGLTVRSMDGRRTYTQNVDYKVQPGTTLSYPFTKLMDAKPDAIARIEGGAIPDGASVIATYNYAEPSNKSELCMSEPDSTRLLAEAFKNTFTRFPQLRYFNLNLDEIEYFNACSLCRADRRSAEDKLGDWIKAINDAVHEAQPEARLFTWDDMLTPYVRADKLKFKDFSRAMPKDVIAFTWGYTPVTPQKTGWPTVRWWSKAGVSTILVPWYDARNVRGWAQVFAEARRRGWPCLGMLDSYWHDRGNYRETAICAWRVPRKGERRWIELDFAR